MHRHGYKGRKFGRKTDQRQALIKSLAESLVVYESIETTLPKAKELVPYMEKLITKAKEASLANRRQVVNGLQTINSAHKLVDEIAPKLKARSSGHLKIERTSLRRGDLSQLARISFVDDLKTAVKPSVKKPEAKVAVQPKKPAVAKKPTKSTVKKDVKE